MIKQGKQEPLAILNDAKKEKKVSHGWVTGIAITLYKTTAANSVTVIEE